MPDWNLGDQVLWHGEIAIVHEIRESGQIWIKGLDKPIDVIVPAKILEAEQHPVEIKRGKKHSLLR